MKIYTHLNFRYAECHDPNLHHAKKKNRVCTSYLIPEITSSYNVSHQISSNIARHATTDYLKLNWRDAGQVLTFAMLLASIAPASGSDGTPDKAVAVLSSTGKVAPVAAPAIMLPSQHQSNKRSRREIVQQREEMDGKISQMKDCKRILDRIIEDNEVVIFSQSYMSILCQMIFDNIREANSELNMMLQTYGDQSCLLDCDETMLKIAANIALLTEKINHLDKIRIELNDSPITPDDNEIRKGIREKKRFAQAVITENSELSRTCENNKARAERVRTDARLNKNNFMFNCDGVFSPHVAIPDFDDHPADTAFYKVRNHVNQMKKARGEAEVEIVQAENERGRLRMVVSPRLG